MDWAEACKASPEGAAQRRTDDGRLVVRFADGTALIETGALIRFNYGTEPEPRHINGWLDWEPVDAPA